MGSNLRHVLNLLALSYSKLIHVQKSLGHNCKCLGQKAFQSISSTLSKIIEKSILARYSSLIQTTENQFGFKSNSSTDLCVFSLKQVIDYYRNNGSPVYLCFLDVSKAFDRVPHNILFCKLFEQKVPRIVIRWLVYWYSTQTFTIRWNNVLSDPFTVSNGVRQGSILSPTLFSVYMDSLSNELSAS